MAPLSLNTCHGHTISPPNPQSHPSSTAGGRRLRLHHPPLPNRPSPLNNRPSFDAHCVDPPATAPSGLHDCLSSRSLAPSATADRIDWCRCSKPAVQDPGLREEVRAMATADLLRREEEFYSSLFDSAKEIKGLFAPPPWGEELPLSAFCRTSVGEWDAFRSIDVDAEARLMQHMERSSEKHKTHVDVDELIALNAWRPIDRQTREAIKRNFLPDLREIYEERVRAFIEGTGDKVLVLNVQDPFQRLLLHGVCEFYSVTSTTKNSVRDGKP